MGFNEMTKILFCDTSFDNDNYNVFTFIFDILGI